MFVAFCHAGPLLGKVHSDNLDSLFRAALNVSTPNMNLFDLTPEQLKRAASIKERIDGLNKQLRGILARLHRELRQREIGA